jgi:hypothetical protein
MQGAYADRIPVFRIQGFHAYSLGRGFGPAFSGAGNGERKYCGNSRAIKLSCHNDLQKMMFVPKSNALQGIM